MPSKSDGRALDEFEGALKRFVTAFLRLILTSPSRPIQRERIRNIIVVRQHDQLGDMICAVPLLRLLKQLYPSSKLTLVASPVNYAIMLGAPNADAVINYDKAKLRTSLLEAWRFFRRLRTGKFDLAVVPSTVSLSLTSDIIAKLSGAQWRLGVRTLSGINNPSAFLCTHATDLDWRYDPHRHQTLRNMDVLKPVESLQEIDIQCTLGIYEPERAAATNELAPLRRDKKLLIGLHPGAGKPENRWPAQNFARIADLLAQEFSAGIVVTAGPMDDEVLSDFQQHIRCGYTLIRNRPIREVAAILDQLDLVISNDTGILHIAGGLRPQVIGLFGPTDPLQWAPPGTKNRFILSNSGDISQIGENVVVALVQAMMGVFKFDIGT